MLNLLVKSGVWPFIRQKPYDIIANPVDIPKAIFISTFKSAPLTIDNDFALYGMEELFQKGLNYIVKLTSGKTHLNIDGNTNGSKLFAQAKGVEIITQKDCTDYFSTSVGTHTSHIVTAALAKIDPKYALS